MFPDKIFVCKFNYKCNYKIKIMIIRLLFRFKNYMAKPFTLRVINTTLINHALTSCITNLCYSFWFFENIFRIFMIMLSLHWSLNAKYKQGLLRLSWVWRMMDLQVDLLEENTKLFIKRASENYMSWKQNLNHWSL